MNELRCEHCFHHCLIREGGVGFCRARTNSSGKNRCVNYGRLTGMAMDPIEKKPLARFHPGSWVLSVGSYGCNLACPFCQNWQISMADEQSSGYETVSAEKLADLIMRTPDNLGIAFTYNEPLISFEYILDVAELVKPKGYKIIAVTNGCVEETVLEKLSGVLDAMNIDLKGDRSYYQELGGSYDQVRHTIEYMHDKCHVEITSLIVPGKNDREEWVKEEAKWLASLNPNIPYHLTRYFPNWKYDIPATPKETIWHLKDIAEEYLNDVLTGNMR